MSTSKVILVLGATGSQGGGVVKALAEINSSLPVSSPDAYKILAVTRSSSSGKAQALLSHRGTVLIQGDVNDPQALFHDAAMLGLEPIYGVFSVLQSMNNPDDGTVGEERQAKAIADEASRNAVRHFVYSSVDMGGLDDTKVYHFESKRRVETYIRTNLPDLPLTILRPTYFMDNLGATSNGGFGSPRWLGTSSAMRYNFSDESKTIQMIATSDIGRAAAMVFEDPSTYVGQALSLAGDELTIPQLLAAFKTVFGCDMPSADKATGDAVKAKVEDLGSMFKFFDQHGYKADVGALRKQIPKLKTWEDFLREEVRPMVEKNHPAI